MEPVWFVLVAVMIIAYVVLDGFDLGAGVLHLHYSAFSARSSNCTRQDGLEPKHDDVGRSFDCHRRGRGRCGD